jgi:hypothetical protein
MFRMRLFKLCLVLLSLGLTHLQTLQAQSANRFSVQPGLYQEPSTIDVPFRSIENDIPGVYRISTSSLQGQQIFEIRYGLQVDAGIYSRIAAIPVDVTSLDNGSKLVVLREFRTSTLREPLRTFRMIFSRVRGGFEVTLLDLVPEETSTLRFSPPLPENGAGVPLPPEGGGFPNPNTGCGCG